jgi:hypothetical protein
MTTTNFQFTALVTDLFRNGTRDNINTNSEILGFIVGAIDNGFTVKMNGYMPMAQKGRVQIFLRFEKSSNDLSLVIFKGKEKQAEYPYAIEGFLWVDVNATKGTLHLNNKFICTFK